MPDEKALFSFQWDIPTQVGRVIYLLTRAENTFETQPKEVKENDGPYNRETFIEFITTAQIKSGM